MIEWRRVWREHALPRVDQHDGEIGGRGAGRHVAGVLLMAGRVGDDELAARGREEAVGDVDGDALLALGLQAVDQQREIDVLAGRAVRLRIALERGELVLEDLPRVGQQPADQRRLAVVHRAAGQEAQQRSSAPARQDRGDSARTAMPASASAVRWRISEISFALLLLHRAGLVAVDGAALPLGGARRPASR